MKKPPRKKKSSRSKKSRGKKPAATQIKAQSTNAQQSVETQSTEAAPEVIESAEISEPSEVIEDAEVIESAEITESSEVIEAAEIIEPAQISKPVEKKELIPSNFAFLAAYDSEEEMFTRLAKAAERNFPREPIMVITGLRMLAEAMAKYILRDLESMNPDIELSRGENGKEDPYSFKNITHTIGREMGRNYSSVITIFNRLRHKGNDAVHDCTGSKKDALECLKSAHELAIFFHRSYKGGIEFKANEFIIPPDLDDELEILKQEIVEKEKLIQQETNDDKKEALIYALSKMNEERCLLEKRIKELEAALEKEKNEIDDFLKEVIESNDKLEKENKLLKEAELKWHKERDSLNEEVKQTTIATTMVRMRSASQRIELSERLTRVAIDEQLRAAGWEADSETLTFARGARPEAGKNKAIAEWVIGRMQADYILFAGLVPVAVVEAKKENVQVAEKIRQAERYARHFVLFAPMVGAWEENGLPVPWRAEDESNAGHYKIPFVYSTNGNPLNPQIAEKSGTWFRDVRKKHNLKRPLITFHRPEHLLELLRQTDPEVAHRALQNEPFAYLGLRDYQQNAIIAVEEALAKGARKALVAMATGTGKTRLVTGLMYRLLKQKRFERILFLVDRTTLGKQAIDTFKEAPLEQNFTLANVYSIAELGEFSNGEASKIQVSTVQAMYRRIFTHDNPPPIEQFDCIIIDEAHRGYTLDQEMTEGEMSTREAGAYLSSYRRVIDYFDAVKIALTATPAKHTSEIFGKPIFTYSYREAVADDWLVDHDPPITFTTKLTTSGITFPKGENVTIIDPNTGKIDSAELEDELHFEVDSFNRTVLTENFNRVICQELVKNDLDIFSEEKTLIFCANDLHADMVKRLLDEAFQAEHGEAYNQAAVAKITGQSDQVETLIRQYKNERYPNIAITVDLLTTGINVPKICNLVFLRRVKSRILFEQMLGRATRRCDAIGKSVFRIFDPVDIYAALESVNTMRPLVKNVSIPTAQLVDELSDPFIVEKMQKVSGDREGCTQADSVLEHLQQKVIRILRPALSQVERKLALKEKLGELEQLWGVKAAKLAQHLRQLGLEKVGDFLQKNDLSKQLDEIKIHLDSPRKQFISTHEDELISRAQTYGDHQRPEDYLHSFNDYIQQHLNEHLALLVAVNSPKDLTRKDLKAIREILYQEGYSDKHLNAAESVAAGIIAHIRRAAIGENLVPYDQRVDKAMQALLQKNPWLSSKQIKWIERLAKSIKQETIIDRSSLSEDPRVIDAGGINQLDKSLNERLDEILNEFQTLIWSEEQYL